MSGVIKNLKLCNINGQTVQCEIDGNIVRNVTDLQLNVSVYEVPTVSMNLLLHKGIEIEFDEVQSCIRVGSITITDKETLEDMKSKIENALRAL